MAGTEASLTLEALMLAPAALDAIEAGLMLDPAEEIRAASWGLTSLRTILCKGYRSLRQA